VFDFYRQNPQAAAQLRAPVYEEKVVELIFNKAKVTDQPVSKEELAGRGRPAGRLRRGLRSGARPHAPRAPAGEQARRRAREGWRGPGLGANLDNREGRAAPWASNIGGAPSS
jgi:hypothetical protein